MRPPVDTIVAPPLPPDLVWENVAPLRMEQQIGRPVLVEFWDFCRVNSLRVLPYLKAWHERYSAGRGGLRTISVHSPGFAPGRDDDEVRAAVHRLGIEHAVVLDPELSIWRQYEVPGWPARYLFDRRLRLVEYHHGEGGYVETERAIQAALNPRRTDEDVVAPVRPEDDEDAVLAVPTAEQAGAYSGPYAAGGAWAAVAGRGTLRVNGADVAVEHPGAVCLVEHERHTEGVLDLQAGEGVEVLAVTFTPGLA